MDYEQLKGCFPEGLVFSSHAIAGYESEDKATGPLIDFDDAYQIVGDEGMDEIFDRGSCIISSEQYDALLVKSKPNPRSS